MAHNLDCNECGWREELRAIRDEQQEIRGDIRELRTLLLKRQSIAEFSGEQISDSTPPGRQREEMRIGPLRVRGSHAVAAVAIAVALIVSTALVTHTVTAEHFSALIKRK